MTPDPVPPDPVPPDPVPLDTPLELPEPADTEALGERLAAGLAAGDLVVLAGPLGAGKTALVRGLARGLRVAGPVTSPTFVIAREHRPLPGGPGVPLVHVDAFRLGTTAGPDDAGRAADVAAELDDLDLDTDLTGAVVAVEWGEGVAERLAARHLLVRLDRRPDDVRVARVQRVDVRRRSRAMIDAVIFDWGGTLTPWMAIDAHDAWRAYAGALHPDDAEHAAQAARRLHEADLARWVGVRDEHRAFTTAHVISDAAARHDTAALDAYREYWVQATHTDPEAAPMLAVLRGRGLRLGVLSSTPWPAAWHEEWLRRDGVRHLFDACVWSSDLPWTKPHPEAFRAALDAVGVADPSRAVYVGDRPYDDVSGAKAVGMRAVLVPHSDIPPYQQVPVDVTPDGVIQRLADLPDLIADW